MLKLFGIKNCDTMKKAMRTLESRNIEFEFHDYKKLGIDSTTLQSWCADVSYEKLLNTRGTTWRKLSDQEKENVNEKRAIDLMVEHPSLIKRPVIEDSNGQIHVGFCETLYASIQ